MPIRVKKTGTKRGSIGYVVRVPIKDIEKISDEDVNGVLKRIYGTNKIKISYGGGIVGFRDLLNRVRVASKFPDDIQKDLYLGRGKREIAAIYYDDFEKRFDKNLNAKWDKNFEVINDGKNITFKPVVALHGVTGRKYLQRTRDYGPIPAVTRNTYRDLIKILDKGLRKLRTCNDNNVTLKKDKVRFSLSKNFDGRGKLLDEYGSWGEESNANGVTMGDVYTVEMIPSIGSVSEESARKTSSKDVLGVNIEINSSNFPKVVEEKIKFYQNKIGKRYGLPVRYFLHEHTGRGNQERFPRSYWENVKRLFPKKNLEHHVTSVVAIAGFAGSLIFLSSNITGNAIADLSLGVSNWIGGALFLVGVCAAFAYFRRK